MNILDFKAYFILLYVFNKIYLASLLLIGF